MNFQEIVKEPQRLEYDEGYVKLVCGEINLLNPSEAKEIYFDLIKYIKEKRYFIAYPWVKHFLGWPYHVLGDLNKSIKENREAYDIFERNNNVDGMLDTMNALVGNYCVNQQFDIAIAIGVKGIELAEKASNYERLTTIKNNMGLAYVEVGEYEKAKSIFKQIELLPNINTRANEIANIANLAECERELGNYDEAFKYFNRTIELSEKYEKKFLSHLIDQLARTYAAVGDYNMADKTFEKSVDMSKKIGNQFYINEALINWTNMDLKLGRYSEAIEKLKLVEKGNEKFDSERNNRKLYYNYKEAYKMLGNYKDAFYYLEKYNELEISLYKEKYNKNIQLLDRTQQDEEAKVYKLLYNQTEALSSIGQKITSNLSKKNIYGTIIAEIKKLIKCDLLMVGIIKGNNLEYQLSTELGKQINVKTTSLQDNNLGNHCIKYKNDILINNLDEDYYKYLPNIKKYEQYALSSQQGGIEKLAKSIIFVPIIINKKVIGVLSTQCFSKNMYTLRDVTTLKVLSTYIGIALENSNLYREIKYNATYDSLTNIHNRREALRVCEKIFKKSMLTSDVEYYLIMIDVDNFKYINDNYGHVVGDEVLKEIASSVKNTIGKNNTVGRYGGEEFIAIVKAEGNVYEKINSIRANIESSNIHLKCGIDKKITASIGVAKLDYKCKSLNSIIKNADDALYKAKNSGKNKVVFYNNIG